MSLTCPNCKHELGLVLTDLGAGAVDTMSLAVTSRPHQNDVKPPQNSVIVSAALPVDGVCSEALEPKTSTKKDRFNYQDPDFEAFMKAYPRRVAKAAAFSVWKIAVRSVEPQRIIAAARDFSRVCAGIEPRWIPHPATWLNAARWDDEQQRPPDVGETDPAYTIGTPEYAARQLAEEDAAIAALGDA